MNPWQAKLNDASVWLKALAKLKRSLPAHIPDRIASMNTATKSPSLFANFRFARFLFVSAACLSFPIASARAANPEATATPTPDPVEEKVNALRDKAKAESLTCEVTWTSSRRLGPPARVSNHRSFENCNLQPLLKRP